jgi:hypothetical protein
MQFMLSRFINSISLVMGLLLLVGSGYTDSHAEEAPLSKTTFYVY